MNKRIVSLVLAAVLLMGAMVVPAYAASPSKESPVGVTVVEKAIDATDANGKTVKTTVIEATSAGASTAVQSAYYTVKNATSIADAAKKLSCEDKLEETIGYVTTTENLAARIAMDVKTAADKGTVVKTTFTIDGLKATQSVIALRKTSAGWEATRCFVVNGKATLTAACEGKNVAVPTILLVEKTPVVNPFTDVATTDYFAEPVLWAVKNGITLGQTSTEFGTYDSAYRCDALVFLWRAEGSPKASESAVNPFTDVTASDYFYDAVLWAYENGIVKGVTETTFGPYEVVNRAQFLTFQYRLAKGADASSSVPASSTVSFDDVKANDYFAGAVAWAYDEKITYGTTDTTFSPMNDCQRQDILSFVYREMVE